jgi:DNA (cytosine-5)-methyltransferase 1
LINFNQTKNVDTTKTITHISLCAGYGGIDIGLSRAIPNLRTIAFSEIEAFACANLVSKMEAGLLDCAPIWTNLKTLPWDGFLGKVDIISGGFPCQPFSCAGKRDGDEDPRHLFPYILDGIRRCRPSIVFLENVAGILSSKLSGENWRDPAGTPVLLHVLRELERVGYKATAGIFSASEVGAPHQRKRVFIMAYSNSGGTLGSGYKLGDPSEVGQGGANTEEDCNIQPTSRVWPSRPSQPQFAWEPPRVVANSKESGLPRGGESHTQEWSEHTQDGAGILGGTSYASNDGRAEVVAKNSKTEWRGGLDDAKNANDQRWQSEMAEGGGNPRWDNKMDTITQQHRGADGSIGGDSKCQTQPSLGGDPNGASNRVGHAELCESDHAYCGAESEQRRELGNTEYAGSYGAEIGRSLDSSSANESSREIQTIEPSGASESKCGEDLLNYHLYTTCDNRTDELRLLGNGVVPATAELAFRTLWEELNQTN